MSELALESNAELSNAELDKTRGNQAMTLRPRAGATDLAALTALRDAGRRARMRLQEQRSIDAALQNAAQVLGREFDADLAVVRLAAHEGQRQRSVRWTPEGSAGSCLLGALPPSWLADRYARGEVWRSCDLRSDPDDLPDPERAALLAAGAVSAMTTPFGTGPEPDGAITLVRCTPGTPWQPAEAEAAAWVATDVARGVQQSRLYEREQRLVDELRELDRSKTHFVSTVSHELRTPLTSISGFVQLLHDTASGPLTADQKDMLEVIDRNTSRLRHLIDDLLTLSRIDAGTFQTVRQPTDVMKLVTGAVEVIRPTTALTVRTDCPPGPLMAEVDPHQIDRVLTNLLSNAAKFTPAGGQATVHLREEGDDLMLSVTDTGMGIPDDEQHQVFTRFFRASNAVVASIQGTGLGLTIVQTIVANHGGDVSVSSQPGEGTTVTVRLPREARLPGLVARV